MTKVELLVQLATKFHKVGVVENAEKSAAGLAIRAQEKVNWYLVGVYERQGDALLRRNIPIYVQEEGSALEQAFYAERLPENQLAAPIIPSAFEAKLKTLTSKVTGLVGYNVTSLNTEQNFATVDAYVLDAVDKTKVVAKKLLITLGTNEELSILNM